MRPGSSGFRPGPVALTPATAAGISWTTRGPILQQRISSLPDTAACGLAGGRRRAGQAALAFAVLVSAVPALAACPTGADLAAGIALRGADGSNETFRLRPDGTVQGFYTEPDYGSRTILAKGIYLLETLDYSGGLPDLGSRIVYSYPPGPFPDPMAGGNWNVEATLIATDVTTTEAQRYSFYPPDETRIGQCRYQSVEIDIVTPEWREVLIYLPELGFAYLSKSGAPDESLTAYEFSEIAAVKATDGGN